MNSQWENKLLLQLQAVASQCTPDHDRLEMLRNFVTTKLLADAKVVIFCSKRSVADTVAEDLRNFLAIPIDRHAPYDDLEDDYAEQDWEKFLSEPAHRVLVCDAVAEEGLNLQGGEKVVVHFDLPLAPNRIEQRLGRVDRYGSGNAIRSFALCCREDNYALAWYAYLDRGLRLFDRSVASLQYLIEHEMRELSQPLFIDGAVALDALTQRTGGEHGSAERELRRIDDQDALDALTVPDEEAHFNGLTDVDGDWRNISHSVQQWMIDILQIEDEAPPGTIKICSVWVWGLSVFVLLTESAASQHAYPAQSGLL